MTENFVEVHIGAGLDSGDILGRIDDRGCLGAVEEEDGISFYWPEERWNPAVLRDLEGVLKLLGGEAASAEVAIRTVAGRDWNARWAASLEPVLIGRKIVIHQSWNSAPEPRPVDLTIDPKCAFGTGYHATTQLLAEFLEEGIAGGEHVLDVGTGSGILAMAALRLGARSVLGIDNDPAAIECAAEYAAVNGFGPELELRAATLMDLAPRCYDIVTANIDRKTLFPLFPEFRRFLSGGRLMVSGLQKEDCEDARRLLETHRWGISKRRERDEWLALEIVEITEK